MFKEDLMQQFAKFVKTNGKYSLGIYKNIEGVFFGKIVSINFFCIKIFCNINFFLYGTVK